jgi:hypothetical protein
MILKTFQNAVRSADQQETSTCYGTHQPDIFLQHLNIVELSPKIRTRLKISRYRNAAVNYLIRELIQMCGMVNKAYRYMLSRSIPTIQPYFLEP